MIRIPYKKNPTEFEVQASLYWILTSRGYSVRGEVTSDAHKQGGPVLQIRFDIVIYDENKKPVLVIEVKKNKKSKREGQIELYKELLGEIPLVVCEGMGDIYRVVDIVATRLACKVKDRSVYPTNVMQLGRFFIDYVEEQLSEAGCPRRKSISLQSFRKTHEYQSGMAVRVYKTFLIECGLDKKEVERGLYASNNIKMFLELVLDKHVEYLLSEDGDTLWFSVFANDDRRKENILRLLKK